MTLPTDLPTNTVIGGPGHVGGHNTTNARVNAVAAEVNTHEAATTSVHGIADTARLGHRFDVRGYGLAETGLKAAIAAAAAAAHAAGGGEVYIPAGTYLYDGWTEVDALAVATASNIAYVGDGYGSFLKLNAGTAGNPVMLPLFGTNISVRGLRFDTQQATNATCVRIYAGSTRIDVTNCVFENPRSGGVYLNDGAMSDVSVSGCHFVGPKYGLLTHNDCEITGLTITGNTFRGAVGGDGIEINTPGARGTDITIVANTISGYSRVGSNDGIGIGVAHASNVTVAGNTVRGTGGDGIHIEDCSHGVAVTGNVVTDCDRAGIAVATSVGFSADTDLASQVNISDNVVTGCGGVVGDAGLTLEGATLSPASVDHIIAHNIVRDCGLASVAGYAGIRIGYGTTRTVVSGNMVANTIGGANAAGICIDAATDVFLVGNRCTDDQVSKTQKYGLRLNGSATRATAIGNLFTGNATAETNVGSASLVDLLAVPASGSHDLATGEANMGRLQAGSTTVPGASSNIARLLSFVARQNRTVTKIRAITGGTAAGATPTLVQFALFQVAASGDMTKLEETANDTTLLAAANTTYEKALGASVDLVAGQRYAIGILITTSSALPTFAGATASVDSASLPRISHSYATSGSFPSSIAFAATSASSSVPYVAAVA